MVSDNVIDKLISQIDDPILSGDMMTIWTYIKYTRMKNQCDIDILEIVLTRLVHHQKRKINNEQNN